MKLLLLMLFLTGCSSTSTEEKVKHIFDMCQNNPQVTFNLNPWFGNSVSISCELKTDKGNPSTVQ